MAREEEGFDLMETYIWRRQNLVTPYIETQLILDLCEAADIKRRERVRLRCWKKSGIDLTGARETEVAVTESDKDGLEEYRRGSKTEDSRIWGNGNGYKVAQVIK